MMYCYTSFLQVSLGIAVRLQLTAVQVLKQR
uniref:Uncharacterized protein n=1 Tax=Tetraselmis sp. GSL018 TaxID=582737 RepID=A0A061RYM9_9CHLO